MEKRVDNLIMENARIIGGKFKNFSGRENKFNEEGDRNFCVQIPSYEQAMALKDDGWNIRMLKPRNDDEEPTYYLQVAVRFDKYPNKIYLVTRNGKVLLDEETVNQLDYTDIRTADISIRPRLWGDNRDRIKAYLKTMYVTIEEDEFAAKYAKDDEEPLPFS